MPVEIAIGRDLSGTLTAGTLGERPEPKFIAYDDNKLDNANTFIEHVNNRVYTYIDPNTIATSDDNETGMALAFLKGVNHQNIDKIPNISTTNHITIQRYFTVGIRFLPGILISQNWSIHSIIGVEMLRTFTQAAGYKSVSVDNVIPFHKVDILEHTGTKAISDRA